MADLNWNTALLGPEAAWRATRGAGVRIALLDSGADLTREELQHLDRPERRFDAARPDFVLDSALTGRADVRGVDTHGTRLLTVLAAESEGDGPRGLAPEAEVFIVKIASRNGVVSQRYFLNGLQIALRLDVDLIVTGQNPMVIIGNPAHNFTVEAERLFAQVAARRIVFVCPAYATNRPAELRRFPADRPEAIVAAAPQDALLILPGSETSLGKAVDFLLPRSFEAGGLHGEATNGIAAAALAGMIAWWLAVQKKQPGRQVQRPDRAAVIAAIQQVALPFSLAALRQRRDLQFFTPHLKPIV